MVKTKLAREIQYKKLATGTIYNHTKSNGRHIYMVQKDTGERVKIYWPSELDGKTPSYVRVEEI